MSVIETFAEAIERMASERDCASATLSDLKAKIDGIDADIERHYAAIGRIHCEALRASSDGGQASSATVDDLSGYQV